MQQRPAPPAHGLVSARTATALGLAGAALLGSALFNGFRARRAEERNPPLGRFIEVDDVLLHYLDEGEGPAVVLLHGNLVDAEDFVSSGIFDHLIPEHRVIAFDRPGIGHSERPGGRSWTPWAHADLLRKALHVLNIERPVVAGHSWGAMVAMALGLRHPEAVAGLVLLGGYYFATSRADVALAAPPAVPLLGDVLCHTVSPLVGAALLPGFIRATFAPRPVPRRFSAGFSAEMALRPSQIGAMAQDGAAMVPAAAIMQRRYRRLGLPVAIMAGAGDEVVDPLEQSARLGETIPHSSSHLVLHAGHAVHYAVPQQVAELIRDVRRRADEPSSAQARAKAKARS